MEDIFQKIGNSYTLSQRIVQQIENLIREKKLLAGQKLPTEKELCENFSVSRTAIREALQVLSAKGLITIRKGSGIYVNEYSSEQVSNPLSLYLEINFDMDYALHLVRVRQMIEPKVAKLAAINRTENDVNKLEHEINQMTICGDDAGKKAACDVNFHMGIVEASGNPILPVIMTSMYKLMPKIKSIILAKVPTARHSGDIYHRRIFDAIKNKDEEAAFFEMEKHLEHAEEHALELLSVLREEKAQEEVLIK
jgi:GntR family transcriptional regulator, transcriptional repressor for pyruvate dehydrogenase complex